MAFVVFNLLAAAALIGIDQAIKLWATNVLQPVGAMPLIPHVVELRFVLNPGMAFSLLSGKQLFLIIATSAALLAVEKVTDVAMMAMEKADRAGCKNVRFLIADGAAIDALLPAGCVTRLYLNFSDPWPKKRNAKRRLTSPLFLERYKIGRKVNAI